MSRVLGPADPGVPARESEAHCPPADPDSNCSWQRLNRNGSRFTEVPGGASRAAAAGPGKTAGLPSFSRDLSFCPRITCP
eukprot:757960-Hanusia_phi.AAC.1